MAGRPSKRQKVSYPLTAKEPGGLSRTYRSTAELLAVERGKIVESANTLPFCAFEKLYSPDLHHMNESIHTLVGDEFSDIETGTADDIGNAYIEMCFELVESTSAEDYRYSEIKWSASKKRKEMRLPDLKYLIMKCNNSSENYDVKAGGFISYMITYEDGHEVLYVYEIHVSPNYRQMGIGRKLMGFVEQTGRNVGLGKVMLTVFRSNTKAIGMYEKLGYSVDKYSPQPKILRNGTLKESGYFILSKDLKEEGEDAEKT